MSGVDASTVPLTLRVGIDLCDVRRIAESLTLFGDRFLNRIFTEREIAYARSAPGETTRRLAARFAAKEATRKALELDGVSFRDIEVEKVASGACRLVLHGNVQRGVAAIAVSLSHEGDYATAVVVSHLRATEEPA